MNFSKIPIEICKDINIKSNLINGFFNIPIATFETTLFKSIKQGALISKYTNPISVFISENKMTRSIILEFENLTKVNEFSKIINSEIDNIKKITKSTSNFCEFLDSHYEIIGNLIFIRFSFSTGEASGHNMTTKAANEIGIYLSNKYICKFKSVSANYCIDKKNSAINGILQRGRRGNAEIIIPEKICEKILKVRMHQIFELNYQKNLIGSNLAGSVRSANAHFANIIAAFYIATGQDVANVVEGSQGFTYVKINEERKELHFSVYIPNIIIGSIGNGKNYDFIKENIKSIGFNSEENLSEKLTTLLTAGVLCSELALLTSLCKEGDLIKSHIKYERRN